jgi:uncharacterized protein (DUF952 family)
MQLIFKIVPSADWTDACATGRFEGSADDRRDGFIHLSAADQLRGTLERHFNGQHDLLLVAYEEAALTDKLKWEASRNNSLFPHYYGPLPTSSAKWQRPLALDAHGLHKLDDGWFTC